MIYMEVRKFELNVWRFVGACEVLDPISTSKVCDIEPRPHVDRTLANGRFTRAVCARASSRARASLARREALSRQGKRCQQVWPRRWIRSYGCYSGSRVFVVERGRFTPPRGRIEKPISNEQDGVFRDNLRVSCRSYSIEENVRHARFMSLAKIKYFILKCYLISNKWINFVLKCW